MGIETYSGNDVVRDVILTKLAANDLVELFATLAEVATARGVYANLNARIAAIDALIAGGLPEAAFIDPIFADLMMDGATPPDAAEDFTTNNKTKRCRTFDTAQTEDVMFALTVPPGYGTVKYRVAGLVQHATGPSSEGVAFTLEGACAGDNDDLDVTYGTAVTVTKTAWTASQYDVFLTDWSDAITITDIAAYEEAIFKFTRDHDHASDTYGQKLAVEKVILNWNWVT